MTTQDELPTGNLLLLLLLVERSYRLLRRDYFYTEATRPDGENPLLLNVTGYLAIAVVVVTFGSAATGVLQSSVLLGELVLVMLAGFFVCFGVHLVCWTAGLLWRLSQGHARIGN